MASSHEILKKIQIYHLRVQMIDLNLFSTLSYGVTRNSAIAEGPRDALVSRNSATTKYAYRVALFA